MSRFRLPRLHRTLWLLAAAGVAPLTLPADQTVQVGPGMFFSPSVVTVAPGETVTWNFNETHTSTSDSQIGPEPWDSGILSSGTFAHTFQTPGTYPYYCALHSFAGGTLMNGVVEVSLAGATPTPTATLTPPASPTPTPPTPTATLTPPASPTPTPPPPAASATPVSGPGAAGVPDLGGGMRVLFGLALAAAGIAALLLSPRR
jgi:plastocyanin